MLAACLLLFSLTSMGAYVDTKNRSAFPPATEYALSSEQITWHDDCSNTSGWVLDPNPPQPRISIQDNVSILSDGASIYSSAIPYASGRWHGSIFFYELESPFFLGHGLEVSVRMSHPGSPGAAGGMEVGFYDQFFNITCWVSIVDSWYSGYFTTDEGYNENGTSYTHSTPQDGSLVSDFRVWHNSATNQLLAEDEAGNYTLASGNQFNPDREIHYVGIMFWNVEDYTYESNHVLDILIRGVSSSPPTDTTTTEIGTTGTTGNGSTATFSDLFLANLSIIVTASSIAVIVIVALVIMRNRSGLQGASGGYYS